MATPLSTDEWDLWDVWMRAQRLLTQELDRLMQREFGISKAEFSMLVTLLRAPEREMRVVSVADSLGWDKSRVSHLLSRMEARGLVERTEAGATGRRTGTALTAAGRTLANKAVDWHGSNVRRYFFDEMTTEQATVIRAWSEHMITSIESTTPTPEDIAPQHK